MVDHPVQFFLILGNADQVDDLGDCLDLIVDRKDVRIADQLGAELVRDTNIGRI